MRAYDHLFFDLDNTLWDFASNSRLAMHETLLQTSLLERLPNFDSFFSEYEKINSKLWNDYHGKKITKQKLIIERFCLSLRLFDINDQNWEELNRIYLENMAVQKHLFQDTIETLEKLRNKGYQMHIITNGFREVQYKKLSNCGLHPFFTKVFVSEEIQCTKPHPEIFEHALKSTNARKKRSIMIGDSWDIDIVGAMNFGIDQIMFLNGSKNEVPPAINRQKMDTSTPFLCLKNTIKTYFIEEIKDLSGIL